MYGSLLEQDVWAGDKAQKLKSAYADFCIWAREHKIVHPLLQYLFICWFLTFVLFTIVSEWYLWIRKALPAIIPAEKLAQQRRRGDFGSEGIQCALVWVSG